MINEHDESKNVALLIKREESSMISALTKEIITLL